MFILVLQRIFFEAFFDILYFPIWWYSSGAIKSALWCYSVFQTGNNLFAPWLWLKNIFVPMYGQYDWQGRIVSFFMRLVQIIARSFALLIWLAFSILLFFIWLALPVAVVAGFILAASKK